MSKRNDTIDIKPVLKAIKAHGKALETAHNRFRAILAAIVECGATRLFLQPANKLAKHEKAALRQIIETARKVYEWKAESAPRVFKRRIKMELEQPGAIAELSKLAREKAKANDKAKAKAKANDKAKVNDKANDKAKVNDKAKNAKGNTRQPRQPKAPNHITISPKRLMAVAESVDAAMRLAVSDAQKALLADALAILAEYLGFEA